jgi:hypothetical protein
LHRDELHHLYSAEQQMQRWECKHIRLDYKGRGITQEFNLLDVDGQRFSGWGSSQVVSTLPKILS